MSRSIFLVAALLASSITHATPITYTIVNQKNERNILLPDGKLLGFFEVTGTITTDGSLGVGLDNLLDWDVTLTVTESDNIQGDVLSIPLEPKRLERVVGLPDRIYIQHSDTSRGHLEFVNGNSYWRLIGNEFEQAEIGFFVDGVGGHGAQSPAGVFAIVVPEPSGVQIIGLGSLLMLAKRRRR